MGKGARLKRARRQQAASLQERLADRMTQNVQKEIRNSELWDQMVAQFGEEKAKQLLKTIKAEVKSGPGF
jgi:hypothetical protein